MTKLNDWKAFELFEREVAVLKGFKHPNIPQFLDYVHSDDEDSHYLVQEYAKGQSLKEKLDQARISMEKALREGRYEEAGELQYSTVPNLQEQLKKAEKAEQHSMLQEAVMSEPATENT